VMPFQQLIWCTEFEWQEGTEMSYFVHETSLVSDENVAIGDGTKIWHFNHVMKNTSIGSDCSFGQNCVIGPNVRIGNRVKVQNNISIYEGLTIEDDVFLGPSMVLTNVINPRSFIVRKKEFKNTLIKRGASIGANATVVCGVTIGAYSFVGAGSVITKDVPDFAMVYGNPGKIKGFVSLAGNRLSFDTDGLAIDPFDETKYTLVGERVALISENPYL